MHILYPIFKKALILQPELEHFPKTFATSLLCNAFFCTIVVSSLCLLRNIRLPCYKLKYSTSL